MRKISNIAWPKATKWQRAVQKAFPKNAGEEGISGDGPWAVLMCDYWHPSARCHCYGNIYLSESREKAEEIATAHARLHPKWIEQGYCHGCMKLHRKTRHRVMNLETMELVGQPTQMKLVWRADAGAPPPGV